MTNQEILNYLLARPHLPRRLLVIGPEGCGKSSAIGRVASHFKVDLTVASLADINHLDEDKLEQRLRELSDGLGNDPPTIPVIQHIQGLTMPIVDTKSHYRTSRNSAKILRWIHSCPQWILEAQTGMGGLLCIIRQIAEYDLRLRQPEEPEFLQVLADRFDEKGRQKIAIAATNLSLSIRDLTFALKMVEYLPEEQQVDRLLDIIHAKVF